MWNPFKGLAASLQPQESVVGIDVGTAYLKVVQLRRKAGKAVLETYGELALGPYGGVPIGRATHLGVDKLAEALRDLLREAHVTTSKAGMAIPFASSLVTMIEMPVIDQKELGVAVPIEARKYIPVPIAEVNLDWWTIPKTSPQSSGGTEPSPAEKESDPQKLQILIAAIHNEAMTRFQNIAKGAGVDAAFFEIEIFGAIRALFPEDLLTHAILDMGAAETKLYIVDQGLLRSSHIINHGAQDLTLALARSENLQVEEAEKRKRASGLDDSNKEMAASFRGTLDFVFSEAHTALKSFEAKTGNKIESVILSGGGANLKGIEEFAARSSETAIYRADPFRQVEAPAFLDEVLKSVGPEFSVALGIAFRRLREGA